MGAQKILALLLLMFASDVVAQSQSPHMCGAGPGPNEVMAGMAPGGNGVAPTPLCYWKAQEGQSEQQAPRPTGYWEKTWGAIAGNRNAGILGSSLGASSKSEASRRAINDCKSKGGGTGCQIEIAYYNQCAVLVVDDTASLTARAASIEEASQLGLSKCKAEGGRGCSVYYSACTEPIFHRY